MKKTLTKSKTNKKLEGVLAGVAEYFAVDPTLVRIGFALVCLLTTVIPFVIVYYIMAWVMPEA